MSAGEERGGETPRERKPVVYCLIPVELGLRLRDALRAHFRDDPDVEVVVERRMRQRRGDDERRAAAEDRNGARERRRVRSSSGRRVGERRAALVEVHPLRLPRRARRYADRITFAERLEPSTEHLQDLDTARLVIEMQLGEPPEGAFSIIYARYFERVYGYLLVTLGDRHEAEDATQQVFLKALESIPGYERRGQPFRAWLFRIARNYAVDQLRRRGRFEPAEPEELRRQRDEREVEDGEPSILEWISDRDLLLFIERLPLAQRQALILRYTADMTDRQIGAILDRSPADVRMLLSRALAFLRQRLIAVGRGSKSRHRARIRGRTREARVLRARRWALEP